MRIITKKCGFTLLELLVVISLISIVLVFTLPRIDRITGIGKIGKVSNWIIITSERLRTESLRAQQEYYLNIDLEGQGLWVSNESMTPEQQEKAFGEAFRLPENTRIHDVVFPASGSVDTGIVKIHFSPKGYARMALVHLEDTNETEMSLVIEPFLNQVIQHDGFFDFEDLY
jgi:prepilin-type N-terminal cleavage/methylation domain-containing protein